MEFRADEHELVEVVEVFVATEAGDRSAASSGSYESEVSAIPSPWDVTAQTKESETEPQPAEAPEPVIEAEFASDYQACPYCSASIERQAFSCANCNAVLTLSDIESLLGNNSVDLGAIRQSVAKMEADWNSREFSVEELKALGVGQFNLKNFELGFAYIQEASRLELNLFVEQAMPIYA